VRARVPLDVDLEDRLVYGLTPVRLAYMVLAVLTALATWSSQWLIAPARGFLAASALLAGAALAWGRWRGRPADGWMVDFALFVLNTRRVKWGRRATPRKARHMRPAS
jgi:hypothetical protein